MSRKDQGEWKLTHPDEHKQQNSNVRLESISSMELDNPSFIQDEDLGHNNSLSLPISSLSLNSQHSLSDDIKKQDSSSEENGLVDDTSLIYSIHEIVPMKDFTKEIRGSMDVERFVNKAILLLNLNETNVDNIIEKLLAAMVNINDVAAIKSLLFTHDNVHQLRKTLQCSCLGMGGGFDYDQTWLCTMCSSPKVTRSMVGIARLHHPANFGTSAEEISTVILILTPTKEKTTKTEIEIGRTFATLFSQADFRQELTQSYNETQINLVLKKYAHLLTTKQLNKISIPPDNEEKETCRCGFMRGLRADFKRRLHCYISDFKDGVVGPKTIQKTLSTTLFLYFAILLPSIAFGVLNDKNTKGSLNVEKVIYSQIFGGLVFALFGGTPQIVLLTTAPLALYTKIIYSISQDFDIDFPAMFGCVGLWNTFFLFIYSFFDLSILMQWSTRSSEEIFASFISIAFIVDGLKSCAHSFDQFYNTPLCQLENITCIGPNECCAPENSVLHLFLLFATVWLGVSLFNFKNTPYLTYAKREICSDYALPASVIIMSFVGSYLFRDIKLGKSFDSDKMVTNIGLVQFSRLSVGAIFGAMGLGFCLSLLFFMDQNISAALVNAPQNKMKKGTAYHWDLFIVGVINGVLSLFAFPWLHAALPHSPLHVLALADVEERVEQGHVYQTIVYVRETRLTAVFSHILIGLSLLILNYLAYIPSPVLFGLFLYVAITALYDNQMFERICLLFTEQSAYPPNHYIRQVPQRKMHFFTGVQVFQLLILCVFGFTPYPYLKMFFPVLIFALIPFRHKIIPYIIDSKYLSAMDGS